MKTLILIISILLAVSCGKGKEAQTKTKADEDNNTKPIKVTDTNATKPIKSDDTNATKLTAEEQKVIGEYESKIGGNTFRMVLLENGMFEGYHNGKKREEEVKWKLTKEGELHITDPDGGISVWRINEDSSITFIAVIYPDGKREDFPKDKQTTWKKIK